MAEIPETPQRSKLTCTIATSHMDWLEAEAVELSRRSGTDVPISAIVRACIRYAHRMRRAIDDWDAIAR